MDIEAFLRDLELTDKEIEVYLACLALGETTIIPLCRRTHLPRTTVFHILERLKDRQLIEITQTRARRLYTPLPPRRLMTSLGQQKTKLEKRIETLEELLPAFNAAYSASLFEPRIRYFRGSDEIRLIYEEILEAPVDEVLYISEIKKVDVVLGQDFLRSWIKRRIAKGIKTRAIWVKSEAVLDEPLYRPSKKNLRSVRYAPADFKSPTHTMVYGDNVVFIMTAHENIGMVITSRDLATSVRNQWKQLWKVSTEK